MTKRQNPCHRRRRESVSNRLKSRQLFTLGGPRRRRWWCCNTILLHYSGSRSCKIDEVSETDPFPTPGFALTNSPANCVDITAENLSRGGGLFCCYTLNLQPSNYIFQRFIAVSSWSTVLITHLISSLLEWSLPVWDEKGICWKYLDMKLQQLLLSVSSFHCFFLSICRHQHFKHLPLGDARATTNALQLPRRHRSCLNILLMSWASPMLLLYALVYKEKTPGVFVQK